MNTFKYTQTTSNQVVVEGTDSHGVFNKLIVDGEQWASIKQVEETLLAAQEFDAAVEEFFRPLTDAAPVSEKQSDFATYTLKQGKDAVEEVLPLQYELTNDSQILRAIDFELFDLLMWVGDNLVVLQP